MKKTITTAEEPSEIKAELLALTGSTASYNALLDNIGEQLRTIARGGHRIVMKGDKVVSVNAPTKRQPRRPRTAS
ncbi:hypothetical protein [Hymenobacter cheonanensis]|uniref:hypothetical protein n=1 Tax=Hymenobacter sp. CA2-7 TaxID=3063993 RepID=UPI002712EB22|nr:hypothetical protein [Hymenobacter sp. CA2-7]MDO7885560.1 hypothetical protein [Hymenobacter sp. CA2-7]